MARRPRIHYTESQKALMWERWRQGESLQKIAQLFARNHSSVLRSLAETGGIRPAQRCRSRLALTFAEREGISRAAVAGQSIRSLAAIAGWLKQTYAGEEAYQVSHETIYRSLYIQARGALKKELLDHLIVASAFDPKQPSKSPR